MGCDLVIYHECLILTLPQQKSSRLKTFPNINSFEVKLLVAPNLMNSEPQTSLDRMPNRTGGVKVLLIEYKEFYIRH